MAIAAIVIAALLPIDVRGALPSRIPTVSQAVIRSIDRADRVEIACGIQGEDAGWVAAFAYSVDAMDGEHLSHGHEAFSNRYDDGSYVAVRGGPISVDPIPDFLETTGGGISFYRVPRHIRDAMLRVAWVGWGSHINCGVYVNGSRSESAAMPLDHAVYVSVTDFEGGVGIAAKANGEGIVAAGGAGTYQRVVDGFLLGLADVQAQAGTFRIDAVAPDGNVRGGSDTAPLQIHERSSGTWAFRLTYEAAVLADAPVLFLIRLP